MWWLAEELPELASLLHTLAGGLLLTVFVYNPIMSRVFIHTLSAMLA
jgi:hypothetical protein